MVKAQSDHVGAQYDHIVAFVDLFEAQPFYKRHHTVSSALALILESCEVLRF